MADRRLAAVGITCGIGSLLVGARQAGFDVVANIEWRKYYHARDPRGLNTFTTNFGDAVFKQTIDDLTPQEVERVMNPTLALGHPESHPDVPVCTSKGWRMVSKIRVGDLVLTHRGRFRRVLAVYRRAPGPDTEKITFSRNSRKSSKSLTLAGNHPVMMKDGSWRRAAEVRKHEEITHLCEICERCGEPAPVNHETGHAGCFCYIKNFWRDANPRARAARLERAHAATAARVAAGAHDFSKSGVRQKGQIVQSRRSTAEEVLALELSDLELVRQYPVGNYFVDFAIPQLKIAIEVDGGNWHKIPRKRQQDIAKERHLSGQGWTIVRVEVRTTRLGSRATSNKIRTCVAEVRRLAMNHRGEFKFAAFKVGGLWRGQFDPDEILYDLSVDEDNSYIAKSVVLHNCGAYSQLSAMNPDKSDDPGDIPLFVDLVARLRPRYFVMDDLPKSFKAFPMREYAAQLPDYDLFPEWISNYHYGNVQKNRRRMFMIGALKSERWAFVPGEVEHGRVLRDVIGDLGEPRPGSNYPNHDPHVLDERCGRAKHLVTLGRDRDATYAQLRDYFLSVPPGVALQYVSKHDEGEVTPNHGAAGGLLIKHKPGHTRGYWDAHAYVLDGASVQVHPLTGLPYTIRERARIQGFPDDFVFYGTRLNAAGEWNHEKNNDLVKQTGKAMPIQFGRYVSEQVMAAATGEPFESSGARLIPPNSYVDEAKCWYCEHVGYADQALACGACWLYAGCSIRTRKYGIGISAPAAFGSPGTAAEAATGGGGTSNSFHPTGSGSEADVGQIGEAGQAAPALAPRRRRSNSVAEPASPAEEAAAAGATGGSKGARPVTRVRRVGTAPARFADLPPDQEYDL